MQVYSPSSNFPLFMYRVKREFLHDAALWPIGAIRVWSAPEAANFAINHFNTHFHKPENCYNADIWFAETFEQVEFR